ncbi:roadblock/LC7 domain-containing protein [Methanobacterium sp. SMA-27]|uniref:roadblock/LC7 domain-containing protein n=1 Tax=Methanobacterium sp. SMA-27 TaxID=1495336 RepID=UPI00064F81D3|nr:roadblock/LC7 domain-containing protein [Methanobacterium sp. SMA-27]
MKDRNLKVELERIVNDLGKVDGVEGSLIIDGNGDILSQRILQDIDIGLFGPMAHVITSSSKRLLNSSNQGDIQRILVESENGKALFLHLGNVHFIVLMKNRANVGLIMVSSKRAAEKIVELTKDLEIVSEEKISTTPEPLKTEPISNEHKEIISEKLEHEKIIANNLSEQSNDMGIDNEIISSDSQVEVQVETKSVKTDIPKEEIISEEHTGKEVEIDSDVKQGISIPVIKPPIAFPDIKKVDEIPENITERTDLILDIYEAIFRAMSIGASKIMGVAPARGLTQKFLPIEQCKKLLNGVNVKSNSTIDFTKIRENANNIPIEERESQYIEDFTRILDVVTDNYGKVMGYGAFRGMVRPEFKIITNSYGPVMKKLGITAKMHPEMAELFE